VKKSKGPRRIILKAPWEIEKLRAANQIVAEILAELRECLNDGISTAEIDRIAAERIQQRGAKPAFKGYHGYPAVTCISVNEEIVHGIPSDQRLVREGDLVSIDLGVILDGYFGDAAFSHIVGGNGSDLAKRLLSVTKEALYRGISKAKAKRRLGDISSAIQRYVESQGFGVVRKFVGHGIGTALHEPPEVPNFGEKGTGPILKPGMVIAMEPMVTAGAYDVRVLDDGWTAVTADGSMAAHFEHTIAITDKKADILSDGFI
jgi:methionyl aminopeptidase